MCSVDGPRLIENMRGAEGVAGEDLHMNSTLSMAPFVCTERTRFASVSNKSHRRLGKDYLTAAEIDWNTQSASSSDSCELPPMQIFLRPVISSNCLS